MKILNLAIEASLDLDDPLQAMLMRTLLRLDVVEVAWSDDDELLATVMPGGGASHVGSEAKVPEPEIIEVSEQAMPIPEGRERGNIR